MQENKQFNRTESLSDHVYFSEFGFKGVSDATFQGFIKVKLAHGLAFSVVIPDVLFLGTDATRWIQPLAFHPNIIGFFDDDAECVLHIDISCGHTIVVRFRESELVRHLNDGSELYRCNIRGPEDLFAYATGASRRDSESEITIQLFHHTTPQSRDGIYSSGHLRSSRWNIQGTKRLTNVGYVYFTPLDQIRFDADLVCIAMTSTGSVKMLVDGLAVPPFMTPLMEKMLKKSLLNLPVYCESTHNRTAVLPFWVEATLLSTQHVWRHAAPGQAVYYEIARPFIQRVGVPIDGILPFVNDRIIKPSVVKHFDYAVIGDARIVSGLAAPFDEEDTRHTLKIIREPHRNLFRFWHDHANRDVFSSAAIELQQFEQQ